MRRRNILKPILAAAGMALSCSALAQVSVTATAGTAGPTLYTSLSDAFAAINAGMHQGAVDIAVTGNTTEPAAVTALLKSSAPSSYTSVLIHPVGGNWTINSAASPAANRGIIELRGADNVTIDGDDPNTAGIRNLTIQAATSGNTGVACIRLSSNSTSGADGADNNTVKNCVIIGSRTSATSTTVNYGINMSNYTTNMTTGAYGSINTTIDNNEIKRSFEAIYANGESSIYLNSGIVIKNNLIGSTVAAETIGSRGIYIDYSSTNGTGAAIIENNEIRVGAVTANGASYGAHVYGINANNVNAGCLIQRNYIHDVIQASTNVNIIYNAHGIFLDGISFDNAGIRIVNNIIRDIIAAKHGDGHGIRISQGLTGLVINHNTIALLQPSVIGTTLNPNSRCITLNNSSATIAEFRNNILVNQNVSTKAMAVYTQATGNISSGIVDKNNYYVPSGVVGFYNGTSRTTLTDWQTATSKDTNSFNINPPFVSTTNLHIMAANSPTVLESSGAVTTINMDIDGDARPGPAGSVNGGGTAPDIGADEFDGKPFPSNDLAATTLVSPVSGSVISVNNNVIPQASFTNLGNLNQTNVPVRYQIIDASNTVIYDDMDTIPSIAAYSGIDTVLFTPAAIPASGTYTIRAIAQLASDVNTANDTITGTIYVSSPLCGTYHIGASQPAPFHTLTSAVNTLNGAGVSCPVVFLLDDAIYNEPNLIQFNQNIPGVNAANTVRVSPNAGANVMLNGSTNGEFIKILSNYVIFDGSNVPFGSSRNLTISDTIAGGVGIVIGSTGATPVTDVAIRNCIVVNHPTNNAIVIRGDNGNAGYSNNITIRNNDIRRAQYGILANCVVQAGNGNGLLIADNVMTTPAPDAINIMGIRIEGVDGGTITNNEIAHLDASTANHKRGIYISNSVNLLIKGNNIHDLGYTSTNANGSLQGIGFFVNNSNVASPSNNVVDSNYITNIVSSSSTTGLQNQTYGISIFSDVKGVSLTNNRITGIRNNHTAANGYAAYGINLQSTGDTSNVTVANNFISDISGGGSATLQNNSFGIFINDGGGYKIYHNSINMLNTSQSGSEVSAAIGIGSGVSTNGPSIDIRNNIFSNTGTTGTPYAIYSGVTAANNSNVYMYLDYNDYYNDTFQMAYFSGAAQNNLAALQAAFPGANGASISVQPTFTSISDLHLQKNTGSNSQIENAGTAAVIGGIATDIDGQPRPDGVATDMGADEFGVPLSVELGAIRAVNVGVRNKVEWRSADETDAARYVIEKSRDGKGFSYLNTIAAKGTVSSYTCWDGAPANGINYYRLKMYSKDGSFTYSRIAQAVFDSKEAVHLAVYPNPVTDRFTLEITGATGRNGVVAILDIFGRMLYQAAVTEPAMVIPADGLVSGTYFIRYSDDRHMETLKISKP